MIEDFNKNTNEEIARFKEGIKLAKKLCLFLFAFIIIFVLVSYLVFSLNLFYVLIFIPIIGTVFLFSIINMKAKIKSLQ